MIKCPICDKDFNSLINHIKEHNLSLPNFRKKYGLDFIIANKEIYDFINKPLYEERCGDRTLNKYFKFENFNIERNLKMGDLVPKIDSSYLFPKETKWLCISILDKKNTFLTGFPGTGKSSLILQLYAQLNRNLFHISCFGDLSYESLIYTEEIKTNPKTGNVETIPKYGTIIKSMKDSEHKAGLLFDEISVADPKVLQVLQPLLESSTRYITIPETGEIITAHDDWVFFATDNTRGQGDEFGMFNGADMMNFALLNRFPIFLEINYLDPKLEKEILQRKLKFKLPDSILDDAIKVAQHLRNGIKSGQFYMTFSIRDLYEWLNKLQYFENYSKAILECAQVTFINKLNHELQEAVREIIKNIYNI